MHAVLCSFLLDNLGSGICMYKTCNVLNFIQHFLCSPTPLVVLKCIDIKYDIILNYYNMENKDYVVLLCNALDYLELFRMAVLFH